MHTTTRNTSASNRAKHLALMTLAILGLVSSAAQAAVATRSSSFAYDPTSGLLTKEIIEPTSSVLCLVTEYLYDAYGNKTSATTRNCNGSAGEAAAPTGNPVIVPRTTTTSVTYNADGTVTTLTSNALGHAETKTFEPTFGKVKSLTGPNGLTTTWGYDTFGRQTLETRADATTTITNYLSTCDLPAPELVNTAYCISTISSGEGRYRRDYYDTLNRKLANIRIDFTNSLWITDGRVDYDALGRVSNSYLSYPMGSAASAKLATTSYDAIGRPVSHTAPDGVTATSTITNTISYNGLSTTETKAYGTTSAQTKITLKNSQGQTASITDVRGSVVKYTYDPFGNLQTTLDALNNATTLTYDARGRKIGMNDPDMGVWGYAYNALGELIRQTDAKGQTSTMVYDKLGRMVTRNEPDLISNWTFDTAASGIGKMATASSNNGYSRSYAYDKFGRLSSTSNYIDVAAPYVTRLAYDSAGRVLTQTYPDGFAIKNIYNAVGYMSQVVNASTLAVYWTANAMDAQGHLTTQTYGNGVVTQQGFDPGTGQLKQQLAGAGNAIQNIAYQYDTLGNLTTRHDVVNGLMEMFSYDTLNRVQTATASSGSVYTLNTYTYDTIGNIKTQSKQDAAANYLYNYTYTYNASGAGSIQPHAVSGITASAGTINRFAAVSYAYDADGNMTTGAGRTVTWNSFNMANSIQSCPGGSAVCSAVSFAYNSEHERVREVQADSSVVITLSPRYDTGLHFEKKYVTNQTTHVLTGEVEYEHYLYAGGMMFGHYVTQTLPNSTVLATSSVQYYVKDRQGSMVAQLDQTGAVIAGSVLSYDIYGKRRQPNGANDPLGLLNNPDEYHGYTGHEMLDSVGLINMNGRMFDPAIGRFMSADPTIQSPGNLQSYNRYTYGWNNPLAGSDPSGYSWFGDRWHALTGTSWSSSRDQYVKPMVIAYVAWYTGGVFANWAVGGGAITTTTMVTVGGVNYAATATIAASTSNIIVAGMASGFVGGLLQSEGDLNYAFKSAISGGITAGFTSLGAELGSAGKIAGQGLAGGVSAQLNGGSFEQGFRYGAMGALRSVSFDYMKSATDVLAEKYWGARIHYDSNGNAWTYGGRGCASGGSGQCASSWWPRRWLMGPEAGGTPGSPDTFDTGTGFVNLSLNMISKMHDFMNNAISGNTLYSEAGANDYGGNSLITTTIDVISFFGMPVAAVYTSRSLWQPPLQSRY